MIRQYSNSQIAEAVDEYIHYDRDRRIIKDRLIDGMSFTELSDKYHLSERRIKAIIHKADVILIKLYN